MGHQEQLVGTGSLCAAAAAWVLLSLLMARGDVAEAAARRELAHGYIAGRSASSLVAELMGGMKSPLSNSDASAYAQRFKRTGSVGNLCETGHLYCDAKAYNSFHEEQLGQSVQDKDIPVFFRESELVVGRHITIVDSRLQAAAVERNLGLTSSPVDVARYKVQYPFDNNKVPERAFLPVELAKALPFSSGSASQVFNLDESSALAKVSRKTVQICEEAVHKDGSTEAGACATSLESLQSLLSSPMLLGPHEAEHVEALALTEEADQRLQGGFTGKVVGVSMKASEASRHAVCHNLMYPSAVYFCHYLPRTRVYTVALQQAGAAGASGKLLHAVAMCHLDTSGWNPRHIAFQNLLTQPGQTEACHWVLQNSAVTFVPAV